MPSLVLYVRLPGLLALESRSSQSPGVSLPLAVVTGKTIRDTCLLAHQQGVRIGETVARARRICPLLTTIDKEDLNARFPHKAFLSVLESLTPTIEPDGWDAAYADLTGGPLPDTADLTGQWASIGSGFAPLIGVGPSKVAARACAECSLCPEHLPDADARWLFPDDPLITARLYRLGLNTFGQVADVGESALVYQFGKPGRLLYQRSLGQDFKPVSPLWPPPIVEARGDYSLHPIDNENYLSAALTDLSAFTSQQLCQQGRFARRLVLQIRTGQNIQEQDWVLPAPVQGKGAVLSALRRLYRQIYRQRAIQSPIIHLQVRAEDIVLPAATTGSLFDSRADERKLALAATRQKLRDRYGTKALRTLAEIPISRREVRYGLWKEKQST